MDPNFYMCSNLQQILPCLLLFLEGWVDCQRPGTANGGSSGTIRIFSFPEPPSSWTFWISEHFLFLGRPAAAASLPCYLVKCLQRESLLYKEACLQVETASIEKKIKFDFQNRYDSSRLYQRQSVQLVQIIQAFRVRAHAFWGHTENKE